MACLSPYVLLPFVGGGDIFRPLSSSWVGGDLTEVFIYFVNDLGTEGLKEVELGNEEAVEKLATYAHLPMHGQGSDNDR